MRHEAPPGDAHDADSASFRRRRALRALAVGLVVLAIVASMTLLFAERWLFSTWDSLSVDEILFHLRAPLTGTDTSTVWEFARGYLPFLLVSLAALLGVLVIGRKRGHFGMAAAYALAVCAAFTGWMLSDLSSQVDLASYLAGDDAGSIDFYERRYHDPRDVSIAFPDEKRNLVYIYLESVELTCASRRAGGTFARSAIPELERIAYEADTFRGSSDELDGALSLPGATWTMGALFAQTSGLPLKLAINGNDAGSLEDFFPDLVTLGDILEGEGYEQAFLIGSEASFGGRDRYFSEHGGYDLLDYEYARETGLIPEDYRVFWGYEDAKLFEIARKEISSRAAGDRPFNFTILTVDTHFEDGFVCDLCRSEFGDDQYANVHACSSRQVADFLDWLQAQDFYENTTVVLCGDHVTMDADFYSEVDDGYQRRVYTAILNSAVRPANPDAERLYSTFDLFPTTLAAMGARIEGERLGLGANLYSTARTLLEDMGVVDARAELARQSSFLERFGGGIGVNDQLLERVSRVARIAFDAEDTGAITLRLDLANVMNPAFVDAAHVVIKDVRTGREYRFDLAAFSSLHDPNSFRLVSSTGFGEEDLPYLEGEAYMTAGEQENVLVASLEATAPEDSYEG